MKIVYSDDSFEDILPILGRAMYMQAKNKDYAWFVTELFILPFILDKRFIFTRMVFMTNIIHRKKGLSIEEEKVFLDNVIKHIRIHKMCDFIYKAQSNVIFSVCPQNAVCIPWGTHIVNINMSDEMLMNSFKKKTRTKIRKALKDGVTVVITENIELIYNHIKETLLRQKSIHYPSLEYLISLQKNLGENVNYFIAVKDGEIQGCSTIVHDNIKGYALYAGSHPRAAYGSLNLMYYEIMRYLKNKDVKAFDFVGTRINIPQGSKFAGIAQFKESFNATIHEGYAFRLTINPMKYMLFNVMSKFYLKIKGYDYMDPIDRIVREEKHNLEEE